MQSGLPKSRRSWSDIVGFVFYVGLALSVLIRTPEFRILLLPAVLHELLVASAFLFRRPLRGRLHGLGPRVAAYMGTFLVLAFVEVARRFQPAWIHAPQYLPLQILGLLLWLAGSCLSLWTVWSLRNCFSVEPQARALITTGPFSVVRHPTYGSYMLEYTGLWLLNPTIALAVVLVIWLAAVLFRIHYEERVLSAAFPEYAEYRILVGRLIPRFPRRSSKAAVPPIAASPDPLPHNV